MTPGSPEEMASQRVKHAGSIAALLILHIFQQSVKLDFQVDLWIDNAEVIRRGRSQKIGEAWSDTLVLDFDMWKVTETIQSQIKFTLSWVKVDSHVKEKLKVNPQREIQGNEIAWRLNEAVDQLAGQQQMQNKTIQEVFKEAGVMVQHGNSFLYGNIYAQVTEAIHGPPLQHYLCNKFGSIKHVFYTNH